MTNTKKIIWRLKEQPTAENLRELVKDGILTKDEAREILFVSEIQEDRDIKSLESEIKFLRELVEKLSQDRSQIVREFEIIKPIYIKQPWIGPYITWCSTSGTSLYSSTTNCSSSSGETILSFSSIQTF